MKQDRMVKAGVLALLLVCAGAAAFAQSYNYVLYYENGTKNEAQVVWNDAAGELSVTLFESYGDYFALDGLNDTQANRLVNASSGSELGNINTRIVARRDQHGSGNRYGTVVLKFYQGGSPYQLPAGTYSIYFDIVANGHHFRTKTGDKPFTFTVSNSGTYTPAGTSSGDVVLICTMEPGDSVKLSLPNTSSAKWTSSNSSVARVTSSGRVTALSGGSATLTATSGSATVKVRINVED